MCWLTMRSLVVLILYSTSLFRQRLFVMSLYRGVTVVTRVVSTLPPNGYIVFIPLLTLSGLPLCQCVGAIRKVRSPWIYLQANCIFPSQLICIDRYRPPHPLIRLLICLDVVWGVSSFLVFSVVVLACCSIVAEVFVYTNHCPHLSVETGCLFWSAQDYLLNQSSFLTTVQIYL